MKQERGHKRPQATCTAQFKDDAELRAQIMKRLAILTSAGLIDLQAPPAPHGE